MGHFFGKLDQNDGNAIRWLLNVVHRQVYKNIEQRSLKGFITIPLYQLCSIAAVFSFEKLILNLNLMFAVCCKRDSKGAFHLSELTGQTNPVTMRISLLIKTIQPDQ